MFIVSDSYFPASGQAVVASADEFSPPGYSRQRL